VVTWRVCVCCGALLGGGVVDDVAVLLGVAASTSPPRVGPNAGSHRGARWRRWQPRMMVVVVDGGGGERKGGTVTTCDVGDVSTAVARFGNTRAPIIN
jgi:hypothetical protein